MGFRDLPMFNKAMLGKQGWRLMTRPDSLCSHVLKGRYYHNGDFLAATRKRHSSQTWRAILAGRDTLRHGLIRRIGDGEGTRIWKIDGFQTTQLAARSPHRQEISSPLYHSC